MHEVRFVRRVAEGRPPRDHVIEDRAERVQIGARIDLPRRDLLGGHVVQRADDLARPRHLQTCRRGRETHDAKVDDLRRQLVLGIRREHDVGGLEIAVHEAGAMDRAERARQSLGDDQRAKERKADVALETIAQRLAVHELHHEERRIAENEVEEAHDVRVLNRRDRSRLALKSRLEDGVAHELRLEHLDGDAQANGRVLGDEHLPHATGAEQLDHAVMRADRRPERYRRDRQPSAQPGRGVLRRRFAGWRGHCAGRQRLACGQVEVEGIALVCAGLGVLHRVISPRAHRTMGKPCAYGQSPTGSGWYVLVLTK